MAMRFDFKTFYEKPTEELYFNFRGFLHSANPDELKDFNKLPIPQIPAGCIVHATLWELGKGKDEDHEAAIQALNTAKKQLDSKPEPPLNGICYYLLGVNYFKKRGKKPIDHIINLETAKIHLELSYREHHCVYALNILGKINSEQENWQEAFDYYSAGKRGIDLFNLGILYIQPEGEVHQLQSMTKQDRIVEGAKKLVLAYQAGYSKAADELLKFYRELHNLELLYLAAMGTRILEFAKILERKALELPYQVFALAKKHGDKQEDVLSLFSESTQSRLYSLFKLEEEVKFCVQQNALKCDEPKQRYLEEYKKLITVLNEQKMQCPKEFPNPASFIAKNKVILTTFFNKTWRAAHTKKNDLVMRATEQTLFLFHRAVAADSIRTLKKEEEMLQKFEKEVDSEVRRLLKETESRDECHDMLANRSNGCSP